MKSPEPYFERPHTISPGQLLSKLPITIEFSEEYKSDNLHWHDYVQIWYVAEGSLHHTIYNTLYIQNPGSIVFVPPYTVHNIDTCHSKTTPRFALISFTDSFLTDNGYHFFSYNAKHSHFEGKSLPVFISFSDDERNAVDDIVNKLHYEFSREKNISFKNLSFILSELLRLLTKDCEKIDTRRLVHISEHANDVTRAVRYMSEHYFEKISLNTLCDVAHMSRRILTKSFREVTGKTAFEILISIRLLHAMYSILYSDLTLSEIAKNVGFVTKSRLANEFSKHFGIPPMEYRKRLQTESLEQDEKIAARWEWLVHPDE